MFQNPYRYFYSITCLKKTSCECNAWLVNLHHAWATAALVKLNKWISKVSISCFVENISLIRFFPNDKIAPKKKQRPPTWLPVYHIDYKRKRESSPFREWNCLPLVKLMNSFYPRMLCAKINWNNPVVMTKIFLKVVMVLSLCCKYLPLRKGHGPSLELTVNSFT